MRRLVFLLLLLCGVVHALPDNLLSLQVYTQSDTILDEESRADLGDIIGHLRTTSDRDTLLKAGIELADKAVRDYAHLRSLQLDLDQLVAQPFARDVSKIEKAHFASIASEIDRLRARLDGAAPEFQHPDRPLSNKEIDILIDAHLSYLTDGSTNSPPMVWANLRKLLSGPAAKWDPLYEDLVKKSRGETALSAAEIHFLKTYGRIRMQLEQLQ